MFKKIHIFVLCLALSGAISLPDIVLAGNITDYSLLAQESIHLDKKATVLSGFVGVNDPSAEPSFKQDVHLLVDKKVLLEEETRLVAPTIYIKRDSVIKGDIYYKDRFLTQDDVTTTGDIVILNAPNDWPLINIPAPPTCAPNTTNPLTAAKNSQMTMPPGRYGDVRLNQKSTVILPGGEYHLNSFHADEDARVLFSGPATLCVANTFQTKSDVFWGPQNDTVAVSGADIQIFVNGTDVQENRSRHSREDFKKHPKRDAVAQIGKKNVFFGQVTALSGTLEIEKASQVNGAYIAKDIIVGPNSVVTKITSGVPVDTTPPLITSVNPADASVLDTSTPVLSADFQDTESGVNPASIQILLDGQDVTSQTNASETGFNFISAFLADGAHVLSISVSDHSGNNAQATVNFTVNTDMSPPDILNISPVDGSLLATTPAKISADFTDDHGIDVSSVQILLDDTDITAQSNVLPGGFEFFTNAALTDGIHTLSISVRDAAGNPAQTSTSFTIDTTAPDIAILIPADGSLLATTTPTISGSLEDVTSGVDADSVHISVDGVDLTSQATITQTTFETLVVDTLGDGGHTITIEVADVAGNSAVQTSGFTTDTIAPVISNLTPANMSTIMANVPTISAAFADSGSGIDIASAQILVDNVNVTPQATVTETGFSYTPTVPFNNGYHTVAVTIADVADNTAQAAYSFNVLVDFVPPTISNITPENGSLLTTATPTLSAAFSDNLTCVAPASAEILLDGVEVPNQANLTAGGFSFAPAALNDGPHLVAISVRDNQGNQAQALVNFTIDTVAPTISNLTPADGSTVTVNTPAISADFADNLSGINTNNVQILLDNNDVTQQAVITAGGFDLTPASPLASGSHTAEVQVADIAGNITQTTFGFTVAVPTPVSGAITQNTTWTLANSPYIVMGNITVNSGITLTIQPGVIVKFDGFYTIEVNGLINAQGTAANPITFTSNKASPARGDWNAIILHGTNNMFNYVTIEYANRGVYVPSAPLGQKPTIQNSTLQNNNTGVYFEPSTGPFILSNAIIDNGTGIFAGCNSFTGCAPAIHDNSIYDNTTNLTTFSYGTNASAKTINAENNWWGSADAAVIESTIVHNVDNGSLAVVDFIPFNFAFGPPVDISNNTVTQRFFDPRRAESASIEYALDADANITLKIRDYPAGTLVRTLVNNQPRLSGANTEAWDGKNNSSQDLPAGLYTYTIEAQTADGRAGTYDPVFAGGVGPDLLNVSVNPSETFSPVKGERLEVHYDLAAPALVTLKHLNTTVFAGQPRKISWNFDAWDGRDASGNILVTDQWVQVKLYRDPLPENIIVIEHRTDLDVTTAKADPYLIRPVYGQVTQITYSINEPADVTVKILTPDGATQVALLQATQEKTAGTYTLQWDGHRDSDGKIVTAGDYRVRVEAVDSFGTTVIRDGNIRVLF